MLSRSVMSDSLQPHELHQAPLSMEFSRQESWSGLPFPTPGDRPDPGIKPRSLAPPVLAGKFPATAPLARKWSNQQVIFVFISFLKISKVSIFSLWRWWSPNFLCVVHLSTYSLKKTNKQTNLTPAMLLTDIPLNSEFTVTNTWVDYLVFLSSVSYL